MTSDDQRPPVWVGHVAMHTTDVERSREFMLAVGMRSIFNGDGFAVLEMRGGTHLVLTTDADSALIRGTFDLMVEDLDATHERFTELGLQPGEIERGNIHDSFQVQDPGGQWITFNSSHVGELPV